MELSIEQLADNIMRAVPVGRWDIKGAAEIDLRLSAVTTKGRPVIIDMAQVTYISSMGIRSIILNAKSNAQKGGKLVLLSPAANVEETLNAVGLGALVPICRSIEEAKIALSA